jgi:hypothetical protein
MDHCLGCYILFSEQAGGKLCSLVCGTYFFDPEDGGEMFLQNVG